MVAVSPIVSVRGSVTIANPQGAGSKRGAPFAGMDVYEDHLAFRGIGVFKLFLRDTRVDGNEITRIYPLVTNSLVFRVHPLLAGGSFIRICTKYTDPYAGSPDYWFIFRAPGLDALLGILESAGYPVDREPRLAGLYTGVDRKMSG
jgi:hypothetical protein